MFGIRGKYKPLITRAAQQTGSLSSPLMVFRPFIEQMKKSILTSKEKGGKCVALEQAAKNREFNRLHFFFSPLSSARSDQ